MIFFLISFDPIHQVDVLGPQLADDGCSETRLTERTGLYFSGLYVSSTIAFHSCVVDYPSLCFYSVSFV